MNQAEVVHARWVHRDHPNLSMLDVCQADTWDSLLLDIELEGYQSGAAPGGKTRLMLISKKINTPMKSVKPSIWAAKCS